MANVILQPFQDLLDRGITASTEATRLCRRLTGRSLRFELQGIPVRIQLDARDEGIQIRVDPDREPDCTLTGMPLAMARLGLAGDTEVFRNGAVRVQGDPVLAQDFQRLLELARPDWEEELARLVGDVAAHQLGNATRGLLQWGSQTTATLARDVGEFLTEESRDLPSRLEVEDFLDEVDRLHSDVERAAVRLARLEDRGSAGGPA